MVHGFHPHSDGEMVYLSDSCNRPIQLSDHKLRALKFTGYRIIKLRPELSIHQSGFQQRAETEWNQNQYGQ